MDECGFFGLDGILSEADLREAVRVAATTEQDLWFGPGGAIDEQEDTQLGHLVRYWLASKADIRPTTLTYMQGRAIDGSVSYGALATGGASDADVKSVRDALLLGAPDADKPSNLKKLVKDALCGAYESGQGNGNFPWSAVFVVSCIRGVAIALGLEGVDGSGAHVGRDALLLATEGHRFYVQEAYNRRFDYSQDGTYRAFCPAPASCPEHASCPENRPVQVGDIIVQDRRDTDLTTMEQVKNFCNIPACAFVGPNPLHGDIVVEVTTSDVITIGGNLQSGSEFDCPHKYSVRRRRFPLDSTGTLVVKQEKLFTQQDDAGNLPVCPPDAPPGDVDLKSTGRIFALLSPVEHCTTVEKSSK